ncbi:radical SAM protein, partial [Myxococcota bacterium]|nr:radical SAM protein [Myxococcota bacterium]
AVSMGINKVRITGGEPLVRKGITTLVSRLSLINGITDLTMTTNGILLAQYAHELKAAGLHRINVSLDSVDPERFREITRIGDISLVLAGIDAAQEAGLLPIKLNCVITKSASEPHAVAVAEYARQRGFEIRYIRQMDLCSGSFWVVQGGEGGNCSRCNKLRLTSTGGLRPCLFSDVEYDIRALGYEEAIKVSVECKPERGTISKSGSFNGIGG